MNLITVFLIGSFLLGMLLGPLAVAFLISALSDSSGQDLGDWSIGLGLKSIWRPALTFNAASELTLKRRSYDEDHDEQKISFGGVFSSIDRSLFDPQDRLHDLFGTPFGFVDERFGVIFDPRDATIGRELSDAQDRGVYQSQVTRGQRLYESVLGVFTLRGNNDGVHLNNVWALIGGSFDSQLVKKIHEYYQKAQAPKTETTALRQLLVPAGTFIGVVLLGMFAAGQAGGGGGGAAPANSTTIEFGAGLLAMGGAQLNRRDKAVLGIVSLLGLGSVAGAYLAFPLSATVIGITLPLGIWAAIMLLIGIATVPFITALFGRSLGPFGMLLGKLYITIGLLGYDKPVITLVKEGLYEVREYENHDWEHEPKWYRFALTRIGVGHSNEIDVWGEDITESPSRVRTMGEDSVQMDGGTPNAPNGYSPTELIKHGTIRGFVPDDVDDDATYVRTDLTTGWFLEAGQNRRLMKTALESAKEEYGGGQKPVSDKWILGSTLVAMFMGAVFNWLVFF